MSSGKVKCTCGWSWNKSDSSKKDMYICHECGRDNSNNMKNGGWLDNYNDSQASAPEGMEGDGFSNVGRNYSPAWGGQFQNGGKAPKYVESKNDPRYKAYQDSLSLYNYSNRNKKFVGDYLSGNLGEAPSELLHKLDDNTRSSFKDIAYHEQVEKKFNKIKPIHKTNVNASAQGIKNNLIFTVPSWKKPEQPVIVKPTTTKQTTKPSNTGWTPLTKEIAKGRYEGDLKNMVYRKKSDGNYDITYQAPPEVSRQPIQAIQNNLRPAGLVQGDFDIDADAEIQPEVRHAKSWKYNTREGRSEESGYVNSPEDMDYYTRLKDFYQTGAGKGLGNKVEITPQYQMGGSVYPVNYVPQAQEGKELTFLQPTSDKLPEGYVIPYNTPSSERAMSIGGENGEPAYLIPSFKYGKPLADPIGEFRKTKEHLGGPFKTYQEADEWEKTVRHPAVERKETIMFPQEKFAMGGSIPGAVGFSYARTQGAAPSNGKYAKKTMASAQNGKEMQFYQNGLDFQPKTISKNGSWLSKYDVAQDGDILDKFRESHPSIRSIQNDAMNRKIQQSKGRGKETTVTQKDNTRTVTPKIGKIATAKEKEQRAIEENKQAQEASELQARKDWVQGSMEEAYKSPLMSPGYFTPEGALIGAMQGAFKMPGHIAEGDYKGAAIDALMALPIGIPAAKRLGRALGPEEGLIGKVSNELNINTSLSKIKKEGQLQGLSEHEIAKKQMEQVGITSNQRKAYTPIVSELAEKYIRPVGYGGSEGTKLSELIKHIKEGGYDPNGLRPERLDAWKLYLGRPQIDKTFSIADTAPALHPSYKPGSLEGMDVYNINSKSVLGNIPQYPRGVGKGGYMDILENPIATDRDHAIMGGYNKIMTKQGTQYNDIWDLEPSMSFRSLAPNKISESPLLENIFYKTNTEGVQVPRAVKIPVSKAFGKPFMSHGNLPYSSTNYVDDLKLALQGEIENIQPQANEWPRAAETMARWQGDIKSLENYPKFEEGGIIKDDRGQWDHPWEDTEISGDTMRTDGYGNIPLYVVPDVGEPRMVYPNTGTHTFPGATKFTEYPKGKKPSKAQNGLRQEQKGLQNLDNLTNFTNYNKPQPGGWLNKYN